MPFYRISEMETKYVDMGKGRTQSVAGDLMKAGMITYPANVILGEETRVVEPGDLVHIRRNERHGLHITEGPFAFFTVKSPAGDGDLYQDYNKAEDAEAAREKLESTL